MSAIRSSTEIEALEVFPCFGGRCEAIVQGSGPAGTPWEAVARTRRRLEFWHGLLSRFDPASELSRLNDDPRSSVAVSPTMARFVQSAVNVAEWTGGLVDPTLIESLEGAGYTTDLATAPIPLQEALRRAPARAPARPRATQSWRAIRVDVRAGTVSRPPGCRLDSGGIAKGLFGDLLAPVLGGHASYAISACGDVRFGGAAGLVRQVRVQSPFSDEILHTFELLDGAAATSGIGRRSWLDAAGRPAHHLLDPATGRPAFTGIVQATALAPTGVQAESLSKAALLSGEASACEWLPYGGVIVYDDGDFDVIKPGVRVAT